MAEFFEQENVEIQRVTAKYVRDLTTIWTNIFDKNMCAENLAKLKGHVEKFYNELKDESLQKQELIQNEIDELYKEANNLCRLLKTNVQLPAINNTDIPLLLLQSELDKSLVDLRQQLSRRREEIYELLLEQESLCEELGESPRPLLADPLPTEEEIFEFREHLEQLKVEKMERINEISVLRREIKKYLKILEVDVSTDTDDRLLNHRQIELNDETFTSLRHMLDMYKARVVALNDRIVGMRKKLDSLWDRLKTSPTTRHKFKQWTDCTQQTCNILSEELKRCETLQSQNIRQCLQKVREEIVEWWEKTLKSEKERSRFSNFHSNCYTEDLLILHEIELEDLKQFYDTNREIFELYDRRKILWERMIALESKASDPGRYNNRGGQLLKEEKERKTIATKLPKIEQQIRELVLSYERSQNQEFLVNGENILKMMANDWENKRLEKEKISSARKNAQTPCLSVPRTPLSVKNASGMLLRKAPSTNNLSSIPSSALATQKRKLSQLEKNTPSAKRSLVYPFNSPSVLLKPLVNIGEKVTSLHDDSNLPAKSKSFKSPLKKKRVIADRIRRKIGRRSSGSKKRVSVGKKKSTVPKIIVNDGAEGCTDEATDDTYDCFEKCIEPDSRSSIIHIGMNPTSSCNISTRSKRLQQVNDSRILRLPNPRVNCIHPLTPLKQSPVNASKKLTTKNLPIII